MSANSKLGKQLLSLQRQQFTGILTIKFDDNKQWILYIYFGKLLWVKDGIHPNRSWQRHLAQFCPNINSNLFALNTHNQSELPKYFFLVTLLQKKIIHRDQIKALMIARTQEKFFDIWQKESKTSFNYSIHSYSGHALLKLGFNLSLSTINLEQILFQSQQDWLTWKSKGLASCSPNHAPLLKNYDELQRQLPDLIFQNMSRLLNSKNTLRDLSFKMDQDILEITYAIVPYFLKGYLRLLEIPDLPDNYSSSNPLD